MQIVVTVAVTVVLVVVAPPVLDAEDEVEALEVDCSVVVDD